MKPTIERRHLEMRDAQEFHLIQRFVAACRRQWPGAMIVLRPNGALTGAQRASTYPEQAPGEDPQ
jgi:hypothetical protein